MNKIYMDNGATSYPKAPGVVESMVNYLTNVGTNVGRGSYETAYEAEDIVYETRELICELMNFDIPENCIFTKNVTESMNVLIKGILSSGDHALVSSMEHNAVMRPLNSLGKNNISFSKISCSKTGYLDAENISGHAKKNTKALFISHASNVSGSIQNLEKIGAVCKDLGIYLIIDAAQSAGFCDIDFYRFNASAIAFTGHKSLLGPQGTGGFIVSNILADKMSTLIEGGTGSLSDTEFQPEYMPDKFEAGTPNIPGLYGLNASLKYILMKKVKTIREKELELTELFLNELNEIDQIKIIGRNDTLNRTPVISLDFGLNNAEISYKLDKEYGIMTRVGLHCAPSAHKTLHTFPNGTVRFGISQFHSEEDIRYVVNSLKKILNM